MKKSIVFFLLTAALVGCDYFNNTSVCNQTGGEIVLKITFDQDEINNWSGGMLAKDIKGTFSNWDKNLTPIDIDVVTYASTYKIKPNACGQIEGGNNRRPNFHFFKKLEIITESDTLRLTTKEDMRKAFDVDRSDPKGQFHLLILEGGKYASR